MYLSMIVALMAVLPAGSIAAEAVLAGAPLSAGLAARWFVFWAVGVRLLSAGVRQIAKPAYTTETILGLDDPRSHFLVRELGFANVAIGVAALASLGVPAWTFALAVVGMIFYALAGANHLTHGPRNRLQNAAMISDLFIAAVLALCCLAAIAP